eukprot:1161265-Pelagomonas_calceolata.AAC.18
MEDGECSEASATTNYPILITEEGFMCLYEQCPRNKEVLQAQVEPVAVTLFGSQGPGAEAVHQEAQKLLAAFQSGN